MNWKSLKMFLSRKSSVQRKINRIRCHLIKKNNTIMPPNRNVAYLTIFHDFEADYSSLTSRDIAYQGVSQILNIEKAYNVSSTYNIVGRLIKDLPDVVFRIKSEGHEIASHSFSHGVLTSLTKSEMVKDLMLTREIFDSIDLKLIGLRSPQSKWNFTLLHVLLDQGLNWSAEDDAAKFPYIIVRKNKKPLIRLPITIDDWLYKSLNFEPQKMYERLIAAVDSIAAEKIYGSIGFHPWIHGEDDRRLYVFENFLKYVKGRKDIKILTFSQICRLFSNWL